MFHLSTVFYFFQGSLLYPTGEDMKKRPLILAILKAGTPRVGSAAGSLLSSVQLDVQESQEMR